MSKAYEELLTVDRRRASRASSRLFLITGTLSQAGASIAQQGTVLLGVFFAATYSLNLSQMGALIAAMTLGWVVGGLFIGSLVDRYGPRNVLLVGTLLLTAISCAIAVASTIAITALLLFLLGASLGAVPLAGTKAVMMAWPRERRGLPMGVRQMGVPLGAMVAALILPSVASRVGLHPIYFGFAAVLFTTGLIFCAALPAHRLAPVRRAQPAVRLRSELSPVVTPALAGFLLAWGQYSVLTYSIPLLHGRGAMSLKLAGVALALAQIGGGIGRVLFGWLSDRLGGRRELVLMATAAGGALLACVLLLLPRHPSFAVIAPLWLLLGITMVGWNALILTWVAERVSVENAGGAMGLTTSAILFGATVCTPVFGWIVEVSGSYRTAWLALAILLAIAATLLWAARQRSSTVTLPEDCRDEPALAGR